jgi:(p)ppGpp synthase/HD superfamily hydrolase
MTNQLTNRFTLALIQSQQWHSQQLRKGSNITYFSHLMSVAALVLEDGGSEDEAIAALLHDAIEDCGGEPIRQEILRLFGSSITNLVEGCTECSVTPKPPWQERKLKYLQQLQSAPPAVIRISLADKLHNARSIDRDLQQIGELVWEKFNGGKEGTAWYYQELIAIYRDRTQSWMVEELFTLVQKFTAKSQLLLNDTSSASENRCGVKIQQFLSNRVFP